MQYHTVADLKTTVGGMLSGIDINLVPDLYGAFETASRILVQRANVSETVINQNILLYKGVVDYQFNPLFFGDAIRDIKPISATRTANDFVYKEPNDDFDRDKNLWGIGTLATVVYNVGNPILRCVSVHTPAELILDQMNSITGWSAGGDANTLVLDTTFYWNTPASLRFNLDNLGTNGFIQKTINAVDISTYIGVGVAFLAIELPNATAFTSFGVRIGSDSSNYYNISNTTGFLGAFISGNFLLVPLDFQTANIVGTPNPKAITYLRAYVNYNGAAQQAVRFGGLWISLPTPMQVVGTTSAIFLASGATAASNNIATVTDQVLLADNAYTIFTYECALAVIEQTGGNLSSPTVTTWNQKLFGTRARNGIMITPGLYDLYNGDNPSSELRTAGSWYD